MERRKIAFLSFGVLMLFVSDGLASLRPSLQDILYKMQELEVLVRQSYGASPRSAGPPYYPPPGRNGWRADGTWGGHYTKSNLGARGARSNTNANTNVNLISRYPSSSYGSSRCGSSGYDSSTCDSSRYDSPSRGSWRYPVDDDDSELGSLGFLDRLSKPKGRRPFQRRPIKEMNANINHNRLRGRYSTTNQNLLSVRSVRYPYGPRSFGRSRNYNSNVNSNINENVNANINDENSNDHVNINEIDGEELDDF